MAQPLPYYIDAHTSTPYPLLATKEINGWYIEIRAPPQDSKKYIIACIFTREFGHKNFMLPRVAGVEEEVIIENVWENVIRFQFSQAEDQVVEFLHRVGRLS